MELVAVIGGWSTYFDLAYSGVTGSKAPSGKGGSGASWHSGYTQEFSEKRDATLKVQRELSDSQSLG
jgi:hypothetical protein